MATESKGKEGKGKRGKGGAEAAPSADGKPSVAAHPKAVRQVAQAKSFGGLAGFVLGGYLSLSTHTLVETGMRAIEAGIICYMVVWAVAVFVWRRLLVLEISDRKQELLDASYAGVPDRVD